MIKKIVVFGGGTAGWMTAAALAKFVGSHECRIVLVESKEIGTVGVGEATLPHLRAFNQRLGNDELEFMQATQATFKLGIEFRNWGALGEQYIHPFGDFGREIKKLPFYHYWLRYKNTGGKLGLEAFSLPILAAKQNRFAFPSDDVDSLFSSFSYAYHIDAGLYAAFLRSFSEARGVARIEGIVVDVELATESGDVVALNLASGERVEGDFFIDCSGFRSELLAKKMGVGFEDWSAWLPCDRAVAIPCHGQFPGAYTRATAEAHGWRWQIPLRHRMGNGYVYASHCISDDEALSVLRANLGGQPIAEPNFLRFKAGKRTACWVKNVVAVGLSGGFLEPLESTSIYLIQVAITKFIQYFRAEGIESTSIDEFNKQMQLEFDRIRDFLILHYHATRREDSAFWQYCKNMQVPDNLQFKMRLFKSTSKIVEYDYGLFLEPSWVAVYLGQGVIPSNIDVRASHLRSQELISAMTNLNHHLVNAVDSMPQQMDFLAGLEQYLAKKQHGAYMSLYGANRAGHKI
ncbi:MAG TPA: tryptophan 7-halogenase [Cellvibrionaceae bacterium]|nr:tryptophan 7-halogenase [Cellvibrionaceae bacterium]